MSHVNVFASFQTQHDLKSNSKALVLLHVYVNNEFSGIWKKITVEDGNDKQTEGGEGNLTNVGRSK